MSRKYFTLLVVLSQLLLLGGLLARDVEEASLPPEFQSYPVDDASMLGGAFENIVSSEEFPNLLSVAVNVLTFVAAAGLCLGRRWGRSLYLLCFTATLLLGLTTPFFVGTRWAGTFFHLYGTTEGMIIALAYFSRLRRAFGPRRPPAAQALS